MNHKLTRLAAAAICFATISASAANATTVTEGPQAFLPSYTGPTPAPDLDAISASATYDGGAIYLSATMAGAIGTTPQGIYIWGVDRGVGTDLLAHPSVLTNTTPPVGQGVKFDSFILLDNTGSGTVFLLTAANPDVLLAGAPTPLAAGSVTISGSTISAVIPRSMLPSQGFDIADYGYNIWPRFNDISGNTRVTDFLPDSSDFKASPTPEPVAWALMIVGFGFAGATLRARRALTA